ncbi:tetratricopeptide repeat protein [Sphingomonas psychrotolerans]|uniref:Ancillary SecYEG translocon subunit n=1 Tax=Sphingomonas psychrotolerans TaxID=1327635 RepID=A0ABU3N272_9SPHN|nr:tetratricopeptide repeat protein [Sphingomonas psychrotolerans]MDT8758650.1 tetratricopeptide repeat protein [Sphingomonas psychrotolerans]
MALPPGTTDEAFLREVDEEYRRDQAMQMFRRYGRMIIAAVVVGLIALAGWLYWQHHRESVAGTQGEQYDAAMRLVEQGDAAKAVPALDKIAAEGNEGYAAMARIAEGNLLLQKNDTKGAAAKFAEVANNTKFEQPYRDLALVRQTIAEYDSLKPQVVIDRLKGLTNPNSPWLGTAGELVAAAYLKAGNRAEAGRLYGQIAQGGAKVPESVRQRAVQLAGVLGVDAIDQSKETKAK